jgi:hypothetical protein
MQLSRRILWCFTSVPLESIGGMGSACSGRMSLLSCINALHLVQDDANDTRDLCYRTDDQFRAPE